MNIAVECDNNYLDAELTITSERTGYMRERLGAAKPSRYVLQPHR